MQSAKCRLWGTLQGKRTQVSSTNKLQRQWGKIKIESSILKKKNLHLLTDYNT